MTPEWASARFIARHAREGGDPCPQIFNTRRDLSDSRSMRACVTAFAGMTGNNMHPCWRSGPQRRGSEPRRQQQGHPRTRNPLQPPAAFPDSDRPAAALRCHPWLNRDPSSFRPIPQAPSTACSAACDVRSCAASTITPVSRSSTANTGCTEKGSGSNGTYLSAASRFSSFPHRRESSLVGRVSRTRFC